MAAAPARSWQPPAASASVSASAILRAGQLRLHGRPDHPISSPPRPPRECGIARAKAISPRRILQCCHRGGQVVVISAAVRQRHLPPARQRRALDDHAVDHLPGSRCRRCGHCGGRPWWSLRSLVAPILEAGGVSGLVGGLQHGLQGAAILCRHKRWRPSPHNQRAVASIDNSVIGTPALTWSRNDRCTPSSEARSATIRLAETPDQKEVAGKRRENGKGS